MPRVPPPITLTEIQSRELKRVSRASSSSEADILRARIVMLAAEGWSNDDIVRELTISKMTVSRWRRRFAQSGMAGLQDAPRPGRPVTLSQEQLHRVLADAKHPSQPGGRWSCRSMAKHAGVSKSRVQQLWEQNAIKPHQTRWLNPFQDQHSGAKFWDVIGLYLNPPNKALVLCGDGENKSKAFERTQQDLPPSPGRGEALAHGYYRHGILTLFATLGYLERKITAQSAPRYRHNEWLAFLTQIEHKIPAGQDIHLIIENGTTHAHPRVKKWLKKHPRFHPHFTPTSSSWLELVETFFRDTNKNLVSPQSFRGVPELKRAVFNYLAERNTPPQRYVWSADTARIQIRIRRARSANSSNPII